MGGEVFGACEQQAEGLTRTRLAEPGFGELMRRRGQAWQIEFPTLISLVQTLVAIGLCKAAGFAGARGRRCGLIASAARSGYPRSKRRTASAYSSRIASVSSRGRVGSMSPRCSIPSSR